MRTLYLYLKNHYKIIFQITSGLLFVTLGIYFIKHEITEISNVKDTLTAANPLWLLSGIVMLAAFVFVQGLMYKVSFEAIHERIQASESVFCNNGLCF